MSIMELSSIWINGVFRVAAMAEEQSWDTKCISKPQHPGELKQSLRSFGLVDDDWLSDGWCGREINPINKVFQERSLLLMMMMMMMMVMFMMMLVICWCWWWCWWWRYRLVISLTNPKRVHAILACWQTLAAACHCPSFHIPVAMREDRETTVLTCASWVFSKAQK